MEHCPQIKDGLPMNNEHTLIYYIYARNIHTNKREYILNATTNEKEPFTLSDAKREVALLNKYKMKNTVFEYSH